jgi:orotidine-5'-phosphate decarboxylase
VPSFGERLSEVFETRGQLCLGIDPHAFLLGEWGLPDTAAGVREFGMRAVEAATETVGIVKPQVAFFERHGSAGYAALETVIAAARGAGLLVIADVKRGDIGSTIDAYGAAWLSPGSPLEVDAMTVVAYQGVGSLAGTIDLATGNGKGVFVLAATSNPEAFSTQTAARTTGASVAAGIVDEVEALNAGSVSLGPVGVVIGATVKLADFGIRQEALALTPILAPGFGEQGARLADARSLYGTRSSNIVANVGRSVLRTGPDGIGPALAVAATELGEALAR